MGRAERILYLLMEVLVVALSATLLLLTLGHVHVGGIENGEVIYRHREQLTTAPVLIHAHSRSGQEQENGQENDSKPIHAAKIIIPEESHKLFCHFLHEK